jgi:hypothetical protein
MKRHASRSNRSLRPLLRPRAAAARVPRPQRDLHAIDVPLALPRVEGAARLAGARVCAEQYARPVLRTALVIAFMLAALRLAACAPNSEDAVPLAAPGPPLAESSSPPRSTGAPDAGPPLPVSTQALPQAGASASDRSWDAGLGPPYGGLSPEQVRSVVMKHTGALRACYEVVAQKDPGLRGEVAFAWRIEPDGLVSSASLVDTTLHSPPVEDCIIRQIRNWQFEASNAPTFIASYPFRFGVGH